MSLREAMHDLRGEIQVLCNYLGIMKVLHPEYSNKISKAIANTQTALEELQREQGRNNTDADGCREGSAAH